ncbi:oligosaccharide flippase family protein [Geodermatophilus sp. CPCC 205506]|uniref:oligosaccharide flippase family protein n=1 Tax=Geodermatophilus sp. CPCC 205506 TaxID=2936596 RepID=UPI003EEB3F22
MERSGPGYLATVRRTAVYNVLTTMLAAAVGVLLARLLGPAGRGDYAAITSLFGLVLVVFDLGLSAAVVFFAARDERAADTHVRTALVMLLPLSLAGAGFVALAAVTFMDGSEDRRAGLLVTIGCVVVAFLAAPAVCALQALHIRRWNVVRLSQPLLFAAVLAAAMMVPGLDVPGVMASLGVSLLLQACLAWWLYRSLGLPRGRFTRARAGPLTRYGLSNMASTVPNGVNGRIDQVVLALLVAPSALGQYAVAVSLSLLVMPLVVSFGNVAFPQIARRGGSDATVRQAVRGAFAVALAGVAVVVVCAPVVVPLLFGPGFGGVPLLLLALAPGAAFFVVNQVLGDLLRGLGRPGLVARSECAGVLVTVVGLVVLVPRLGTMGAAVTSSVTYIAVFLLLWSALRAVRSPGRVSGTEPPQAA